MSLISTPSPEAVAHARRLADSLPVGQLHIDGVATPLPEPIAALLREMLLSIANGQSVALVTADSEMTPNDAAQFLNVSRGYITKLMDEGALPFRMVGTHRRIPTAAVAAHKARQQQIARAAMDEIVRISEEMDLYEDPPEMPAKSVYRTGRRV
jgi:excisionase family DNA binding protein